MSDYLLLAIGVLLTIGTGLFVASEFSLINVERIELEAMRDSGKKGLDLPIKAVIKTSTHLSAAQLGITLTTLLTGYVAEPALTRMLGPGLLDLGVPEDLLQPVGIAIAMTIATAFSFLIGELVPKNMALSEPVKILKLVVGFQVAFTWVFGPLIHFLNSNGNWLVRRFGIEPKEELSSARSPEELSSLLRRSVHLGSLEQDTAQLLEKTISLSSLNANDVMTPRPKMYSLSRDESAAELIELARSTGHSRFPVSGEDEDDIVGVVHLKRAITIPLERRTSVPVSALMVEPLRVPETMPLDALILQLRGKGLQFGVVIDEYGGTAGIVTLEDAIEELVGDLDDEHDKARSSVTKFSDGSLAFSGLLRPAELKEYGLVIAEDEDYDTVSGFIMSELEKIPEAGDQVKIPAGFLTVTRMDGRRVDRVRFEPIEVENE